MFVLIRYVDDGIYYVCSVNKISKKNNDEAYVKYDDGHKYLAKILCTNKCRKTLNTIKRNLISGIPKIECTSLAVYPKIMKNTEPDQCREDPDENEVIEFVEDDDDSVIDPDYDYNSEELLNTESDEWMSLPEEPDLSEEFDLPEEPDFPEQPNLPEELDLSEELGLSGEPGLPEESGYPKDHVESEMRVDVNAYKKNWVEPPQVQRGNNPMNRIVETSKSTKKKYFCIYCKKVISHFPRHLQRFHSDETDVKQFLTIPKGALERKQIIDIIRKQGSFQYNCDVNYNKGSLITVRRPNKPKASDSFLSCPKCLGFYSKSSLKKHFKNCSPDQIERKPGSRTILVMGRKVQSDISKLANETVRNHIFPVLRDDEITKPLRYDILTIIYANKMTVKYRKPHHFPMIRSRIRLIGRILFELKKLNQSVKNLSDLYQPRNYDSVLSVINIVAKLDVERRQYGAPSTASSAGTLLKKCGQIYITELIKEQNKARKEEVEDFMKLLEVDYGTAINKTVIETQSQLKRQKTVLLPSMDDIRALNVFLADNRRKYFKCLSETLDVEYYKKLQCFTLISVQVFNRRRAGEIQRIEVNDFTNYQSINQNTDPHFFQDLSEEFKKATANYVRFTIRGKLGREVPVLLYGELVTIVKLLIKNRVNVGIPENNPFIFAIPGTRDKCHDACKLLREFSVLCGAKHPSTLRGTTLRKHMATQSSVYNLTDTEVSDLANFMGHAEKIHREHYRMPIAAREITRMSRLLEMAQGGIDEDDNTSDEDESVNDTVQVWDDRQNFLIEEEIVNNVSINNTLVDDNVAPGTSFQSKKKRSTSPMGTVQRKSWNSSEVEVANKIVEESIKTGKLPSLQKCQDAIVQNKPLQNRSPMQLKAWINNQLKKYMENKCTMPSKKVSVKRTPWNTPEKSMALSLFGKNIRDKTLPSMNICRKAIRDHPTFQNRTAIQLKLWISNQIQKNMKRKD